MSSETKSNGQECYEHVLLCVDDALVLSDETNHAIRNQIGKCFAAKKQSIGLPTRFLGSSTRKVLLDNMDESGTFSSIQCEKDVATKGHTCFLLI